MKTFINKLKDKINSSTTRIDSKVTQRTRKVDFNLAVYATAKMSISKDNSYTKVVSDMITEDIYDGCKSSIKNKRDKIEHTYFKDYYKDIMDFYYKHFNLKYKNKYCLKAIDGTKINLPEKLATSSEQIKPKKNEHYVQILAGGLYDITNDVINDIHIAEHKNERLIFLNQLNYVNKNDIIIADRGYFSYKLLSAINNKSAFSVFRLKSNSKHVKELLQQKSKDSIFNTCDKSTDNIKIQMRVISYKVKTKKNKYETYYLGTTLLNKKDFCIKDLSNIYKKRWKIEVNFKHIKHDLNLNAFHSLNLNGIRQEAYMHQYLYILTRMIENKSSSLDKGTQFNKKHNLKYVGDKLLSYLHHNIGNINILLKIKQTFNKFITKIRNGRTYNRIKRIPGSKWSNKRTFYRFRNKKFKKKI